MKTLTLIDSFGFFFRLYYAMSSLKSKDGKPSGMVYGFANFITTLKNEFPSDYIVFALDSGGKTFRNEIFAEYKANRSQPPAELKAQLPVCIEMIEKMGFCSLKCDGFEADDVIASFIKNNPDQDLKIRIVTHDKDLYQLIDDRVSVFSPSKRQLFDRKACYERYGVYPEQIRDFLAITGDSSDNIPGVKGIGDKGAKNLLDKFGSLEQIYENIENIANERTKNLLIQSKQDAFLSKKLASLYDKLPTPDLKNAVFPDQNPLLKIQDILEQYSLNKLLFEINSQEKELKFEPNLITNENELENLLSDINENSLISFDTETTGLEKDAKIVGFSFCLDGQKAYYIPINHNYLGVGEQISNKCAKWAISQIFKGFVIGHNLKYDFAIVKNNFDLDLPQNYADTMILAWLQNPASSVGMDNLALRLYDYETIKFENLVKKGETFASVNLEDASKYASEDAWITFKFYQTFRQNLEPKLFEIASVVEFPFILSLLDMEKNGIKINLDILKELITQNNEKIRVLTNQIYELCGESFNINSTKQLGEVLFERLKLPYQKKTKTGYSTDESVLLTLKSQHPAIQKILEYRELYKLQSTYCEPLLNLALKDKNNRIYTNFIHTGTSTGRLSSKNPNLQNIPARGNLAKQMRSAFVAKDGFSLISLDYSQIELRLLAHFSMDPALIKAFVNGEDIHARTAISIFGDSQPNHRAIAKSINFGLIYGMGASKLADEISIDKKSAKEYIQRYFAAFGTIKEFLENIKNQAKNDGFVSTLLGRKRFFDFSSTSGMQIAMFEREAVNTKFQGSAADIIKLAMLKIRPQLNENANLLLQIHDELIFEVKNEIVENFAQNIKNEMQNIVRLNVPLVVGLSIAQNWGDLK